MIFLLVFWLFLLGALAIGWQAGDRQDHKAIFAIGAAAALTSVSHVLFAERVSVIAIWVVDLALLAIMIRYSLSTKRHWPIWFTGFHITGLLFGAAALLFPVEQRMTLLLISGFWAIPALAVMVVGLLADQRHGINNTSA